MEGQINGLEIRCFKKYIRKHAGGNGWRIEI